MLPAALYRKALPTCTTLLMACFIKITFKIYFSATLLWSFFFYYFQLFLYFQSQSDCKVVNSVCLFLVTLEEKQQCGEPCVSWAQEAVQTSSDISCGKSHQSGLLKCLESALLQVHQPIDHSISGLIPKADGLWPGPGSAKARLCHRAKNTLLSNL